MSVLPHLCCCCCDMCYPISAATSATSSLLLLLPVCHHICCYQCVYPTLCPVPHLLLPPALLTAKLSAGSCVGSSQMLKRDKMAIRSEKVYNALYNAMFGIIVGWGWTGLLAAECANSISYTFTCPTEHTFKTIFLFACNR